MNDMPATTTVVKEKKEDGQALLISAAREMLAEQPPSNISSRRLAKRAGVHHTLMNYTHGSIAELFAAAYRLEKSEFNGIDFGAAVNSASFPLAEFPEYWRAYVYLTLDAYKPALKQELLDDHSIIHITDELKSSFPNLDHDTAQALAIAWWTTQIGALIFEKPFSHGFSISLRQRELVREIAAERVNALISSPPSKIKKSRISFELVQKPIRDVEATKGRDAAEQRLLQAAIELLKERADTGISGRALAKRADVNYGLIHHYFGSKDGVFDKAFVHMHDNYVRSRVNGEDERLAEPFSMIAHESFLRNWAFRELAGIAMPQIDLKGQRLLLDTLCQRHNHERRSGRAFAEIQADAYCSLSLQLGWVICRQNVLSVVKVDEADLLKRMTSIVNWFVTRSW